MELVVGVISDTHGRLRPQAVRALRESQLIVHAGDIGAADILHHLARLAPVRAVRGNADKGEWAQALPVSDVIEVGGLSIYVLHDLKALNLSPPAAGFAAVISGHSHQPGQVVRGGVLYFNPGSAGPRRFHLPASVGKLFISASRIRGEILML
jgi:putative phosphoesterase